jgi:alkanesulfonate monooxygenase SsuD/methylene tetrahydromethanopterin reductase-like flavin-dependent oxidoreductase (luciferase family)
LLAKQVATLDVFSGGRVVLGVGAGWLEDEFRILDKSFRDRGARMTEMIAVLRACWAPDPVEFHGKFATIPPSYICPKPVQGETLPVLVGGQVDRAIRRAATVGDGWIVSRLDPGVVRGFRERLNSQALAVGRPEPRIVVRPKVGDTIGLAALEEYKRVGVTELIVDIAYADEPRLATRQVLAAAKALSL